jgi:uncharacterized membrane protein
MPLGPLLAAPAMVQLHAGAALSALVLGALQFALPKGVRAHRVIGWAWVALMAAVAVSSFWITGVAGPHRFSWIHGLSAYVLLMLPLVIFPIIILGRRVRALSRATQNKVGDISAHAEETISAIRTIHAMALEDAENARFTRLSLSISRRSRS